MAENLAITFDNWIITPPDGIIARQYDNLSRDLVVTGTFPEGYLWEMLIWCKGNYNTLAMTQSEGQLSTTLTDEDLAFDGYYKMQLRGTIGEEVRHTNIICVKIPCSIDGDMNWPEIPSIYREYLQQVQQLVQDAQTYAGNAETDATTATQAAQTATGAATQAQGYAQTAETASTDAQDAASTAQSAESDAEQHADNAQASADQAAQSAAETADKIPLSQKGAAGGVATLGSDTLIPAAQLPVTPVTKGGTGATTAAQAAQNLNVVPQTSGEIVKQYTHAKSGVTHNLTGPAGAKVIQFVATADYSSGDLVAVNGITLKATDLRGLPLPDKTFVTGSDVIALVPNSASGGSITFQVLTPASNPNLLDNWYFVGGGSQQGGGQFPINQRGQTSYTDGYTIDRWELSENGGQSLTIDADGITLTSTAQYGTYLNQKLDQSIVGFCKGKSVTFSAFSTGQNTAGLSLNIYINDEWTDSVDIQEGLSTKQFVIPTTATSIYFNFGSNSAGTCKIIAAKLELGPVQTLAHQDAEGNWVLNDPPPNFQQELAKCQRYSATISKYTKMIGRTSTSVETNVQSFFNVNTTLRALPSLESGASVAGNYRIYTESKQFIPTSVVVSYLCSTGVILSFQIPSGAGLSKVCQIEYVGDEIGLLSANL